MKDILPSLRFNVVDLETTGFAPEAGDRIIEVASVRIENGRLTDDFQEFVNPRMPIPEEITDLTGITDRDVRGADPVEDVLARFHDFAGRGESILIAHNAPFDRAFLRHYSPEDHDYEYLDTLRMARPLCGLESHSLSSLIREFDLQRNRAHRALDDARATAELFLILSRKVERAEDYLRCDLPPSVLEKSPHDIEVNRDGWFAGEPPRSESEINRCILRGVRELERNVGTGKLAKILGGSNSKAVEKYRRESCYGVLDHLSQKQIAARVETLLGEGRLEQSEGPYPVLRLTRSGLQLASGGEETIDQLEPEGPF